MNFSYFFQHENNIPDYGFPFSTVNPCGSTGVPGMA